MVAKENSESLNNDIIKVILTKGEILDKVRTKSGELPSKKFEPRNSLLTDLFEIPHIASVYNIAVAVLLGFFLNTVAYDYLYKNEIKLGFSLIRKGFANFHLLILIWLGMFMSTFLVYFGFKFWAGRRIQLKPNSWQIRVWDQFCLSGCVLFYPSFLYFSTWAVTSNGQQIAAAMGLLIEMARMLMKCHAFVRSNAPKVLNYKPHNDKDLPCPNLEKFVYFSFAPTLVYQDTYPRTSVTRWDRVAVYCVEFFGALFFVSFLLERFYIPVFENYGEATQTWKEILVIILGNFAPAFLLLMNVFYIVLHLWQNAFSEILGFSDRLFYKDWWTSSDYGRYYRTWNVVVHDWLFTYVYKDFYEIVTPKNKTMSKLMVFFISAVFHDYILGFAFKFFLPITFINFFGFGVFLHFFRFNIGILGNILFWYTKALGMSIISAFFTMEYYARINCPIENVTFSSYFIPQLFICSK